LLTTDYADYTVGEAVPSHVHIREIREIRGQNPEVILPLRSFPSAVRDGEVMGVPSSNGWSAVITLDGRNLVGGTVLRRDGRRHGPLTRRSGLPALVRGYQTGPADAGEVVWRRNAECR
jgi:hypothetical protein